MQNLFALVTLVLLLSVAVFAQQTGMPAASLYVLPTAMAAYFVYTLVTSSQRGRLDE